MIEKNLPIQHVKFSNKINYRLRVKFQIADLLS